MSSKKKKSPGNKKNPATVKLTRRQLLDGHIDTLTPENVTNSGKNDRGWMDSVGVKAAGMGMFFNDTPDPFDMFISNSAFAKPGIPKVQFELYPPLEVCGNYGHGRKDQPTTRENLLKFLKYQVGERENSFYKDGQYTVNDNCPHIDHPKEMSITSGDDTTTTNADLIVLYWYERNVDTAGSGDLPEDLTAKEQFAALYFSGRAIVIVQATNFERHTPSIDVMDILSSIRYIKETPYFGFTRGLHPVSMTFRTMLRTPPTDGVYPVLNSTE